MTRERPPNQVRFEIFTSNKATNLPHLVFFHQRSIFKLFVIIIPIRLCNELKHVLIKIVNRFGSHLSNILFTYVLYYLCYQMIVSVDNLILVLQLWQTTHLAPQSHFIHLVFLFFLTMCTRFATQVTLNAFTTCQCLQLYATTYEI